MRKNPSLVSPTFDIDQLAKNIKSNNIVGSIDRRLYFTFAELHNYVFYCFWLIILKTSRGGGVGRLPYENAWNIMVIILLKGGNADFGLNSGCWDRRAIYPQRYHLGLSVKKILMVCTLINHRNDINMFKTQVEPCRQLVSVQSFQHFHFISVVCTFIDHSSQWISISYCKNCVGIWSLLTWATPRFVSFLPNTPGLLSWTF